MEVARGVSLREVYEAKNLARVIGYIRAKSKETEVNRELILLLHQMLIGGIDDNIAGRFRGRANMSESARMSLRSQSKLKNCSHPSSPNTRATSLHIS